MTTGRTSRNGGLAKRMKGTRTGNLMCPWCRRAQLRDRMATRVTHKIGEELYAECDGCGMTVYWVVKEGAGQ